MSFVLFGVTAGLGLIARAWPALWGVLLALVAFLPSNSLFYGINDYAVRAGVLTWLPVALASRRGFRLSPARGLTLWLLIVVPGNLYGYLLTGSWLDGLVYTFTHTGLSLTYVLLVGIVIPGVLPVERFLKWFAAGALVFYAAGGMVQYALGRPILVASRSDSYNYLVESGRMVGLFEVSSHSTAVVLNVCAAILFAWWLHQRRRITTLILFTATVAAIVLCQNRANMIALALSTVAGLVLVRPRRWLVTAVLILVMLPVAAQFAIRGLGAENVQRLQDWENIEGRVQILAETWTNRSRVWRESTVGMGLLPETVLGRENYFAGYFRYFGENQVLDWIGGLGWPVAVLMVVLVVWQVSRLWSDLKRLRRRSCPTSHLSAGWALLLSWLSLAVAYMSNTDSKMLIPLLFALTVVWRGERRARWPRPGRLADAPRRGRQRLIAPRSAPVAATSGS